MEAKKVQRISIDHQMNESWHIPRASLAGSSGNHTSSSSSSNSSNKSHSNPSTVSRNFKIANDSSSHHNNYNNNNNKKLSNIDRQRRADSRLTTAATALTMQHGPHRLDGRWRQSNHNNNNVKVNNTQQQQQPKRGSHSSQGSSDSNNSSSQSISSGSLLLTAANLERFAEIHKKQNNHNNNNRQQFLNSNYNTNLMLATMPSNLTKDAVISIEQQQQQNLDFVKTKDMDTVSMASSTHFTMVNGEGGPSRKTSGGGICSRGKQVTVLITTMSLLFLFVIIGMVYALELRAREMPKS